jgi:hypothetical protein
LGISPVLLLVASDKRWMRKQSDHGEDMCPPPGVTNL